MTQHFEYDSHNDADRIAILESRAADLERRLLAFVSPDCAPGWHNVVLPGGPPDEAARRDPRVSRQHHAVGADQAHRRSAVIDG